MEETMKPILTGFFDNHQHINFEHMIDFTNQYGLDQLCIRSYNHKPLIEVTDSDIKLMVSALKAAKHKIAIMDSMIKPFDIHSEQKFQNALDEFKYILKIAEKLKVSHVMMELPIFSEVIQEFELINNRLEPFVDAAMKSNRKIIIKPSQGYKANVYQFIIKKMKTNQLGILYDPVYFMLNNESSVTSYRILKDKIYAFAFHDAYQQGQEALVGYGKADVVSICKKLIRDKYDGFILMDNSFTPGAFDLTETKKGFFSKLFSNEKKKKEKYVTDLSRKIFPNEETKNVTYDDILENQIKLVKTIFK
jgi:sugar phosphate isomerase/epimerase